MLRVYDSQANGLAVQLRQPAPVLDCDFAGDKQALSASLEWAASKGKRFLAIARAGVDGHAFAFSEPPDMDGALDVEDGCDAPCQDIDQFSCGCADAVCHEHGAGPAPGEENARRWVVYEVPPEFAEVAAKRASSSSKRKSSKKRRAPKQEL